MGFNSEDAGRIVIDLESVASPDAAAMLDPVRAPSNWKDPAKIAAYVAEKQAEQVSKAALEPDLCEVVAIGIRSHYDGLLQAVTRGEYAEAELLERVWVALGDRAIIGYNCLSFDLPVLIRRSQLLGVKYPSLNLDRFRTPHVDLMQKLSFNGALTFRSLAFYKRRFKLDVPEDPYSGADIAGLVAAGNWQAVADHVRCDVQTTAALAQRLGYL